MRMEPRDVIGSLYSKGGLRFGGFQTVDFLEATEPLEKKRPGVREEIVAEAHYLVSWVDKFPEIAFFLGIILYQSVWIALLLFAAAFILEIIRFYIFGPSLFSAYLCKFWGWIKIPLFIIAAIVLWPENNFLSIVLLVFLAIQGWLGLISTVGMFPIRVIAGRIVYKKYGGQRYNIEGMTMNFVIYRWRLKLFPTDKFNVNDESQ